MHLIGKFGFFFYKCLFGKLKFKEKSLQIFEISVKKNQKNQQQKTVIFLNSF